MFRSTSVLFSALLALFVLSGSARADDLYELTPRDADRAVAALPVGGLFVDWISSVQVRPTIYKVVAVRTRPSSTAGRVELEIECVKVAQARTVRQPADGPFVFETIEGSPAERIRLGLRFLYAPSSELPGTFINLGKKLGLDCTIRTPAIEVGEEAIAAIGRLRTAGLIGALGTDR